MSQIIATVKGIRVFDDDNASSVQLTLDKEVEGYKQDENGVFVKSMTNQVSFFRSALTAQLCAVNDDIALFRAMSSSAFTQAQFALILFGAKVKLNVVEHKQGEEVTIGDKKRVLERDCVFTEVQDVILDSKAQARLSQVFTLSLKA